MELKNIKDNAKKYSIPIIRTESHKYLVDMIKKYQPKNILEIGTAVGYSGILMLENCDAFLTTIEHNKHFIKQANRNFKTARLSKRVKIIEGDCLVELAKMVASNNATETFDFIFLDGPKAQYDGMLEMLLLLLKEGGVFIADNVT
ncbi:MAG: class I SAM-dependent methyltransferase, partial [Clostridia bacterium]|nr:class I SAM-dependent methyltransferase [Clostridia bacterium]